ncbi:MAG: putative spermidine/putrescine transport system substrate-binding protein [Chloroflexota bacterium]|nr:putative spermidine/putrescine transport system substrate-binding protein [Chloroflexota bacterium]
MKRLHWLAFALAISVITACAAPTAVGAPASASATAAASASAAAKPATEGTVTVTDGGGTYHDSLVKTTYAACEQQTGIKVASTSYDYSLGAIKAQVAGAKAWDVVTISGGGKLTEAGNADLYLPIDYTVVNTPGLTATSKQKYWVDFVYSGQVVAYRADKFTDAPKGWAALWDTTKYPGARSLISSTPRYMIPAALLADGVAPDKLFPLDVERGLKKLEELMGKTKVVWSTALADQMQNYASGVTVAGMAFNGRVLAAAADGQPLAYQSDGMILGATSWAVLKTAQHPKAAMEFIKCATQAKIQAADATDFRGNIPANPEALKLLDAKTAAAMPTPTTPGILYQDEAYWSANLEKVLTRWNEGFAMLK